MTKKTSWLHKRLLDFQRRRHKLRDEKARGLPLSCQHSHYYVFCPTSVSLLQQQLRIKCVFFNRHGIGVLGWCHCTWEKYRNLSWKFSGGQNSLATAAQNLTSLRHPFLLLTGWTHHSLELDEFLLLIFKLKNKSGSSGNVKISPQLSARISFWINRGVKEASRRQNRASFHICNTWF